MIRLIRRIYSIRIYPRRILLWRILCWFRVTFPLRTDQGIFKIIADPDDIISKHLFIYRAFELGMANNALKICRQLRNFPAGTGTILDIGANNGVISIGMLTRKEFDHAICIEPDPSNFQRMIENYEHNGLSNQYDGHNVALSNTVGTLDLEISLDDKGDHRIRKTSLTNLENNKESFRNTMVVPGTTLDEMASKGTFRVTDIAVIWMDTQGHEGYIMEGGKAIFQQKIPVVCEVGPYLILRCGMPLERYIEIVTNTFDRLWIQEGDRFVERPIEYIEQVIISLGNEGDFTDVIYC